MSYLHSNDVSGPFIEGSFIDLDTLLSLTGIIGKDLILEDTSFSSDPSALDLMGINVVATNGHQSFSTDLFEDK